MVRLRSLGRWQGLPIALVLIAVLGAVRAVDPAPVESLRLWAFDALQNIKPRDYQPAPVIIVDIDDPSLARLGQWPWSRYLVARLVNRLAAAGVLAIGFDILFVEPDRLSPESVADSLPALDEETRAKLRALPKNDVLLAQSFHQTKVVLGIAALHKDEGGVALPPFARAAMREVGGDPRDLLPSFDTVLHSIPTIANEAAGQASLTVLDERDGVVRRVPLIISIGGELLPALSIEMIRQAAGVPLLNLHRDERGLTGIGIGPLVIPTAPDGRVWIHYTRHRPERYVSAADIIEEKFSIADLAGYVVLIGSTSIGLGDHRATPVEARMPGVEIHAQLIETMLTGTTLSRPSWLGMVEVAIIVLFGALATALVPAVRASISPAFYAVLLVLLFAGAWIAYDQFHVLFDPAAPALAIGIIYTIMLMTARVAADRERKRLAAALELQRRAAARIEGELAAARSIQLGILPRKFPPFPERPEFDIYAMLQAASAVGGDLYDFALIDEHQLFFMIGDVSGKGVQAALFMAITKALYKSNVLRGRVAIDQVMRDANGEITRENPASFFVTVVAGLLDLRTGELELCNAGHEPPMLVRPNSEVERLGYDSGPPLCALDDYPYVAMRFRLQPADAIVLVTDGVTEAQNQADELYGAARARAFLAGRRDDTEPTGLVDGLYADVLSFAADTLAADDTAILALRYNGPS